MSKKIGASVKRRPGPTGIPTIPVRVPVGIEPAVQQLIQAYKESGQAAFEERLERLNQALSIFTKAA